MAHMGKEHTGGGVLSMTLSSNHQVPTILQDIRAHPVQSLRDLGFPSANVPIEEVLANSAYDTIISSTGQHYSKIIKKTDCVLMDIVLDDCGEAPPRDDEGDEWSSTTIRENSGEKPAMMSKDREEKLPSVPKNEERTGDSSKGKVDSSGDNIILPVSGDIPDVLNSQPLKQSQSAPGHELENGDSNISKEFFYGGRSSHGLSFSTKQRKGSVWLEEDEVERDFKTAVEHRATTTNFLTAQSSLPESSPTVESSSRAQMGLVESPGGTKKPVTTCNNTSHSPGNNFKVSSTIKKRAYYNALHRAGPREKVHFLPKDVTAGIVTCGGLCPGLNSVIHHLVNTLYHNYGVQKIMGIRGGYHGMSMFGDTVDFYKRLFGYQDANAALDKLLLAGDESKKNLPEVDGESNNYSKNSSFNTREPYHLEVPKRDAWSYFNTVVQGNSPSNRSWAIQRASAYQAAMAMDETTRQEEIHIKKDPSFVPIVLRPETVASIHLLGGTVLGSTRGGFDLEKIAAFLEKNRINILFIIGGDGTHRGAYKISQYMIESKRNVSIVGVPKTIDNDIGIIDRSFGFLTAVEEATKAIKSAKVEAASNMPYGIGVVKLMGRSAGYISVFATIAMGTDVDLCLIPEVPVIFGDGTSKCPGIYSHLERVLNRKGHAVIVVAEGAGEELLMSTTTEERDASGNKKLPKIGEFLTSSIKNYFANVKDEKRRKEVTIKYIDPSYMIRSVGPNALDSYDCAVLSSGAVHAAMSGLTGFSTGMVNGHSCLIPIPLIERHSPRTLNNKGRTWERVLNITKQPNTVGL